MKVPCKACGHEVEVPSGAVSASCPVCRARVDVTSLDTRAVPRSLVKDGDAAALIGRTIGGFELVRVIGRGGMGVVYEAKNAEKTVALKVLAPELRDNEELLQRFQRESSALSKLRHPNLIEVYAHGVHELGPYFVMEFFHGEDLRRLIARGPTPPRTVAAIVRQAAAGLAFAHQNGIVHRDVKPANILVKGDPAEGGLVKVVDFGVAHIAAGEYTLTSLTSSALLIGTINYMAPEQRVDASVIDRRADVYALGVVAYELLTGKLPIGAFSPPSELVSSLPKKIDQAIISALRQDPDRRSSSVEALATALDRAVKPIQVPAWAVIVAGGVVGLGALGGIAMGLGDGDKITPAPPPQEIQAKYDAPPAPEPQQQQEAPLPDPLRDLASMMTQSALDAAKRAREAAAVPEPTVKKKPVKQVKNAKEDVVELK